MSGIHTRPRSLGSRAPTGDRQPHWAWLAVRFLGAVALLVVGAVHLQQYFELYSSVPTIGTLFVLNFAASAFLSAALLAPIERWGGRRGGVLLALAAVGGVG